jgi:uncharacterized membrane protein YhaH (DUF805 family)
MEFGQAVRAVILERYAEFRGRAPRSEFWWFALFCLLLNFAVGIVGAASETLGGILNMIVALGLLIPSLAVSVRRLHDTDRTGWWLLLYLVPIVGVIVLIVFFVQRGTPGANRFGADPLGNVAGRFA